MQTRARSVYLVNRWVDWLVMGGLSIAALPLVMVFVGRAREAWAYTAAATLVWVINWPHFSATSYRLYHRWENVRQFPMTALLVPVVVLMGVVGSLQSPEMMAPIFIKLYLIWSPYHFSGQTFGISMLYARRAGFRLTELERGCLQASIYGSFITQSARAEAGLADGDYYGIAYPHLGISSTLPDLFHVATIALAVVCVGSLVLRGVREGKWFPPVLLLPATTQYVWFVLGSGYASFNEFVPMFHSLQYMLVAWIMQLGEQHGRRQLDASDAQRLHHSPRGGTLQPGVLRDTLWWGTVNFVGGMLLFHSIPTGLAMAGYPANFAMGVFIAGVQVHHFFVDGVIWKLRDDRVASALLGSLGDYTGSSQLNASPPSATDAQRAGGMP